ncbi:MAG: cob(I)yrinic acid a,c-diamide adenosyltransferase [Planctomycetota bacterium]
MKIYTKTGDDGATSLLGGGRVSKASVRIEAIGAVDELNSIIGLCRVRAADGAVRGHLARVQSELFRVGAELAASGRWIGKITRGVGKRETAALERAVDRMEKELPLLTEFILPGGSEAAALVHLARSFARRAERRVVALEGPERVRPGLVRYLNRLSDFLFVAARIENHRRGAEEETWRG